MERGPSTFNSLVIGDRVFRIPIYQRHYSWDKKQWEDLWNDLIYLKSGKKHYFGTLLLKSTGKRETSGAKDFDIYEVIDGQQRITTALMLLKEVISRLDAIGDADLKDDLKTLREEYLRYRDIYKLKLLGDDEEYFRRNVIDDETYPDEILTPSQKRLMEAKQYFKEKLGELEAALTSDQFKNLLLELKRRIGDMEIIRYNVQDDSDAVLIFETVNDRGKALTNLEKTKSFLMHAIYLSTPEEMERYLNQVNVRFSDIYRWIEEVKNTKRGRYLGEDDIQRYHFVIYETEAKGSRDISYAYLDFLKNRVRNLYRTDEKQCLEYALDYTKDLRTAYYALKEIITSHGENTTQRLLKRLYTLERVANFYPLLIAAWIRFREENEKLEEILRLIEVIVFRVYAIGRKRSDAGESWLYDIAFKVHSENLEYNKIIEELRSLIRYYKTDRGFERDLRVENFYRRVSTRDKKYLLFEYEKFLRTQNREPLDIKLDDILSYDFEIEHIWADDPSNLGLSEEMKIVHEENKDRLGNCTLASQSWNHGWGNKPFAMKKNEYRNSNLRVQRDLSPIAEWGKEQIGKREDRIVKFALERWNI